MAAESVQGPELFGINVTVIASLVALLVPFLVEGLRTLRGRSEKRQRHEIAAGVLSSIVRKRLDWLKTFHPEGAETANVMLRATAQFPVDSVRFEELEIRFIPDLYLDSAKRYMEFKWLLEEYVQKVQPQRWHQNVIGGLEAYDNDLALTDAASEAIEAVNKVRQSCLGKGDAVLDELSKASQQRGWWRPTG